MGPGSQPPVSQTPGAGGRPRAHEGFRFAYAAVIGAAFVLAIIAGWTSLGRQIDNNAYDFMFRVYRPAPWPLNSIVLAVDEESLQAFGGIRGLRPALARALGQIKTAKPSVVALDVILSDPSDPASDALLESALASTPNLVLSCDLLPGGTQWEDPLPRFARAAVAIGHVHAEPDGLDGVTREVPLEKATARERRWAMALEAYRVSRGAPIVESPGDVEVGDVIIPAARADGRPMRIRYIAPGMSPVPRVSLKQLRDEPGLAGRFAGKAVFVGVTAQTYMRDRPMTPYSFGFYMPGVEIHANAFETIAHRLFLTDAPVWSVLLFAAALSSSAGLIFAYAGGWRANALAAGVLAAAHLTPYALFTQRIVFPVAGPVAAAWFSIISAAAYQQFVVRRRLRRSETDRLRYQQTMHFVTHELRTPLTAIQGSSELISRYALPEEKRKQIAQVINSESKRLARMIEVFLNVERLSAGQMELKQDSVSPREVVAGCVERVRPLAERKQIEITMEELPEDIVAGDRELMEYAFYNLLTNAVKYSPPQTQVRVYGRRDADRLQVSVRDQGIGIDEKEVRKIFQKFYRTKNAEQSGEAGTGIGLSIVEQIILQHGGTIDVTSSPGHGSCFTVALPARVPVPAAGKA
jgi:signal transduction histidine kinase